MIIHPASRPRYEVASLKSGEYLTRLTRLDLTNFQKKNNRVKRSGETPKRTNNKQREIHARATSVFSHAPHRFKSRLKHSQINHRTTETIQLNKQEIFQQPLKMQVRWVLLQMERRCLSICCTIPYLPLLYSSMS